MSEFLPKFKLVLFNEYTLKPVFTLLGNSWRFAVVFSVLFLGLIVVGFFMAIFLPLDKLYESSARKAEKEELVNLHAELTLLEQKMEEFQIYTESIRGILQPDSIKINTQYNFENEQSYLDYIAITERSIEDSLLRMQVERIDLNQPFSAQFRKTITSPKEISIETARFVKPLDGVVSQRFFPELGHYGIDIVAAVNSAIMSVAPGSVIWSDWTVEAGNSIAVMHRGGIVSIYKHNSQLLKKVGSFVNSGEAIAIIGNTGELTDGPHLHFELWHEGQPLNPLDFFDF